MSNIQEKVQNGSEAWAVVNGDLAGPAWSVGKSISEAWEKFRLNRDGAGINSNIPESEFIAVRVTPQSVQRVLTGNPDAWRTIESGYYVFNDSIYNATDALNPPPSALFFEEETDAQHYLNYLNYSR